MSTLCPICGGPMTTTTFCPHCNTANGVKMPTYRAIITRYSENSGVTLQARIITPANMMNGDETLEQISTIHDFDVTVKGNGLSDYECCVIDLAALLKDIASKSSYLTDLTINLGCLKTSGDHGTNITYSIKNVSEEDGHRLTEYFTWENGGVLIDANKRPPFSSTSTNVEGYLNITVSKNAESIIDTQTHIIITPWSAQEVLDEVITQILNIKAGIWNTIRESDTITSPIPTEGENSIYDASFDKHIGSGYNSQNLQISTNLNSAYFGDNITLKTFLDNRPENFVNGDDKFSITDYVEDYEQIKIKFEVKDNFYGNETAKYRLSPNGTVRKIDYYGTGEANSDTAWIKCTSNDYSRLPRSIIGQGNDIYIHMGGITLTCKLTLGEASAVIEYPCSVASNILTSEERMTFLKSCITNPNTIGDSATRLFGLYGVMPVEPNGADYTNSIISLPRILNPNASNICNLGTINISTTMGNNINFGFKYVTSTNANKQFTSMDSPIPLTAILKTGASGYTLMASMLGADNQNKYICADSSWSYYFSGTSGGHPTFTVTNENGAIADLIFPRTSGTNGDLSLEEIDNTLANALAATYEDPNLTQARFISYYLDINKLKEILNASSSHTTTITFSSDDFIIKTGSTSEKYKAKFTVTFKLV